MLKLDNGETAFVNINLVLRELEFPYMKKDGTPVSVEEIRKSKANASRKYAEAIQRNADKEARVSS